MKREIFCAHCEEVMKKQFPTESPYPGERVKFVSGVSKRDCVCDSCGESIAVGDKACAFSVWADYGGLGYYPWEDEYIETEEKKG